MPKKKAQPLPARELLVALRAAGDAGAGLLAPDAVVSDLLVVVDCPDKWDGAHRRDPAAVE